jgi:ubiquinone/menaquinone biosynthesis C-methylase UbiE
VEFEPVNVYFRQADACDLPLENHCFDTVISVNALQTMVRPEMALMEMGRVLKPGGDSCSSHIVTAIQVYQIMSL